MEHYKLTIKVAKIIKFTLYDLKSKYELIK